MKALGWEVGGGKTKNKKMYLHLLTNLINFNIHMQLKLIRLEKKS